MTRNTTTFFAAIAVMLSVVLSFAVTFWLAKGVSDRGVFGVATIASIVTGAAAIKAVVWLSRRGSLRV